MLLAILMGIVVCLFFISQRLFLRPLSVMRAQAERIENEPGNLGSHIPLIFLKDWNQAAQASTVCRTG